MKKGFAGETNGRGKLLEKLETIERGIGDGNDKIVDVLGEIRDSLADISSMMERQIDLLKSVQNEIYLTGTGR